MDRVGAFLLLALALGSCAAEPHNAAPAAQPDTFPPLHAPLDSPLVITATFGEFRGGHFHGGLDFSTGREHGRPVYAPLEGWVSRVRASGGGYGRSITLTSPDGRSILFGHLDAFAPSLGDWIGAKQDSSGDYEQDLWPALGQFPVRAGDRVAWSGSSGAGPPHLHMEVRRGDIAFNPLLAGLAAEDTLSPAVVRLTLEPVGESWVDRSPRPRRVTLAAADTVIVEGRIHAWVQGVDPGVTGSRMAPFATWVEWEGRRIEARFARVAWDEDMCAVEWVYDGSARVTPGRPIGLRWTPAFRASVFDTLGWDGTIVIAPGEPARALTVGVRDAADHEDVRTVWIRGPRPSEQGPDPAKAVRAIAKAAPESWERLTLEPGRAVSTGARLAPFEWRLPAQGAFDTATVSFVRRGRPAPAPGLQPLGDAYVMAPASLPLRRAASVSLALPDSILAGRAGLYVNAGSGWRLVPTAADSTGRRITGAIRSMGTFALMRDVSAPRALLRRPPLRTGVASPYPRWALEVSVVERGSGVEAGGSGFVVDGVRVPTEYDVDEARLRWRPRTAPAPGRHRYEVVVTDRAGNVTRATGAFVVK